VVIAPSRNQRKNERSIYEEWALEEGIPILDASHIEDLRAIELAPWERKRGRGAFLHHEATPSSNNCYVCEIPASSQLNPQRHMYEEMVYILSGRGSTSVWQEDGPKQTFEWQRGSLFAIPLNAHYQHFNLSGREPARYLAVTNAPVVMNMFASAEFVFNNCYVFGDRFASESDYFSREGERLGRYMIINFVPDVRRFELVAYRERGAGGKNTQFKLSKNTMGAHISEFPVGTYKKAHRHGAGAHVIILSGQGYSLMWREGRPISRYDWHEGGLIIPGDMMFHQHFNSGPEPVRYLALRFAGRREKNAYDLPLSTISTRQGGHQIEYEDQDPLVHQMFVDACAKSGAEMQMTGFPNDLPDWMDGTSSD
jgi:mannose-6-phosphate isomerase-like protein (cupin superfamily)